MNDNPARRDDAPRAAISERDCDLRTAGPMQSVRAATKTASQMQLPEGADLEVGREQASGALEAHKELATGARRETTIPLPPTPPNLKQAPTDRETQYVVRRVRKG